MGKFHTEPAGKREAAALSTGMGHLQGDAQKGSPKRGHPERDNQKGTTQKGTVPKMLPPTPFPGGGARARRGGMELARGSHAQLSELGLAVQHHMLHRVGGAAQRYERRLKYSRIQLRDCGCFKYMRMHIV